MNQRWTRDLCMASSSQHPTRIAWRKADRKAYQAAVKNHWYADCVAHMEHQNQRWGKAEVLTVARRYGSVSAFKRAAGGAYMAARVNGWLDEATGHMEPLRLPKGHWTKEKCAEEASKHSRRIDWRKASYSSYIIASKNGWLDECTKHMGQPHSKNQYANSMMQLLGRMR